MLDFAAGELPFIGMAVSFTALTEQHLPVTNNDRR
jgi:hypothetical protein